MKSRCGRRKGLSGLQEDYDSVMLAGMAGERIYLHGGPADGWSLVVPKLVQAIVVQDVTYTPSQNEGEPYYPDWYAAGDVADLRERKAANE